MNFGDFLHLFLLLIAFFAVLFGAYYVTKLFARFQSKKVLGNNIKVIESIMIGPQKTIQLVKVGQEYLLIGVTKDHITYLKSIENDQVTFNEEKLNGSRNDTFNKLLEKIMKKHV